MKGTWSLWTWDCDWFVRDRTQGIGDSGSERRAALAAKYLNGQKLESVSITRARTVFNFDLGGRLETRPRDLKGELWHLHCPDHFYLLFFADGTYQYLHGSESHAHS